MPKELGKLVTRKIGIPYEAEKFVGPGDISLVHPNRAKHSHKGQHGRLLIIGGNETYSGAPALTGLAAYSTGIDLVYIAAPETAAKIIAGFSPSLITLKLNGDYFSTKNIEQIEDMLDKVDAVALGPGLGLKKETVNSICKIIEKIQLYDLPIIIDADGLKAFSESRVPLKTPTVFTPHSREFQKLTGKKIPQDFVTKAKLVEEEALKLNSIILLKGDIDIISDGVITRYNLTGNPGMTVGGSGDVLTGIISGFIAMGSNPFYSSCAAAFINGESGDKVFEEKGFHILPEDLISKIPLIIQKNIIN
jgi:NAD(P)H-hydrate epimerase